MGKFITDQILGMKWLNTLIGNLLGTLGLDATSRIGGSIQFFLYDVIKITVLLCVLIYLISYIQSYFPPERSKKIMGRFHGNWGLEDPTGKSDEEFKKVIDEIRVRIMELKQRLGKNIEA